MDEPKYAEIDDIDLMRTVDEYGTIRWYNKEGQLHRTAGPAMVWENKGSMWYYEGRRHREGNLPAAMWSGIKKYYHHGVRYFPEIVKINNEEIII